MNGYYLRINDLDYPTQANDTLVYYFVVWSWFFSVLCSKIWSSDFLLFGPLDPVYGPSPEIALSHLSLRQTLFIYIGVFAIFLVFIPHEAIHVTEGSASCLRFLVVGRGGLVPPGRASQGESGLFRTL